jgi:hypothetical protein
MPAGPQGLNYDRLIVYKRPAFLSTSPVPSLAPLGMLLAVDTCSGDVCMCSLNT